MPRLMVVLVAALTAGCTCHRNGERKVRPAPSPAATRTKQPPAARPRVRPTSEKLTGTAIAYQVGDRVYMWTDGRNGATSMPSDQVWWLVDEGWIFPSRQGGYQLLGAGGHLFRLGDKPEAAQAVGDLLQPLDQVTPPTDWKLEVEPLPNGRYRVYVDKPRARRKRMGIYRTAPSGVAWMTLMLTGEAHKAPPLPKTTGWKRNPDGKPIAAMPEGAAAVDASPPDPKIAAEWTRTIVAVHGKGTQVTGIHAADLDGDGTAEGFACATGGTGDSTCYAIDPTPTGPRLESLGFSAPPSGGDPIFFQLEGHTYAIVSGVPHRLRKVTGPAVEVIRFDGTGYRAEPVE